MIDIILVEDHNVVRRGIKIILEKYDDIRIVAETCNGSEALDYLASGNYADIVLTDISMPVMDGVYLATVISAEYPSVKVIMLSAFDKDEYITQSFKAGARGYVFKNASPDELYFAVKHVNANNKYISSELALRLLENTMVNQIPVVRLNRDIEFSEREIEVLNLISQGFTNQEIADKLFTSKRTVEGYRQSLLQKTGQVNSAALIKFAVVNGAIH